MDIKKKFLELTSRTYPHGTEHELFDIIPQNLEMDDFGNLFIKIGESDVMFTSHFDTATRALTSVTHVFDGDTIKTDGKSILGADDKAGVVIMLNMIENEIPGLYYFFLGEEVGCVGSKKVSEAHSVEKLSYINKVISFDRRGTDSVITFQGGSRCASDEFAEALSVELNKNNPKFSYKTDPTGVYTDSAQFVKIYSECTNISVGYYNEHTFSENQDIDHLTQLAETCLKVDWNSLPSSRDFTKVEYDEYGYYGGYGFGYGAGYSSGVGGGSSNHSSNRGGNWSYISSRGKNDSCTSVNLWGDEDSYKTPSKLIHFYDDEFELVSSFTLNTSTQEIVSIDLSKDRVLHEESLIFDFLNEFSLMYDDMSWDGLTLTVRYVDKGPTRVTRKELSEFIPELDLVKYVSDRDQKRIIKTNYPWNNSEFGRDGEDDHKPYRSLI